MPDWLFGRLHLTLSLHRTDRGFAPLLLAEPLSPEFLLPFAHTHSSVNVPVGVIGTVKADSRRSWSRRSPWSHYGSFLIR